MKRSIRLATSLAPFGLFALAAACGGAEPVPAAPCPRCPEPPPSQADAPAAAAPTPEDAKRFIEQVDKDLRRLWTARDRAGWVNQNFITEDTEALAAAGEEATAAYVTEAIQN